MVELTMYLEISRRKRRELSATPATTFPNQKANPHLRLTRLRSHQRIKSKRKHPRSHRRPENTPSLLQEPKPAKQGGVVVIEKRAQQAVLVS
jgi:hypothetical protein